MTPEEAYNYILDKRPEAFHYGRFYNFDKALLQYSKVKNSNTSPIIIVDQFTGINPAIDMYDDIHPNGIGEKKMAKKWFIAIKKYLRKFN